MSVESSEKRRIGSIASKDRENRKIPLKKLHHVKYYQKMRALTEISIPSRSVSIGANGRQHHPHEHAL